MDGQPPTGRESLGGSIGSGRRSYSRPVDSAARRWLGSRTPATSDCSWSLNGIRPASPCVIWEALRGPRSAKERCREPAALDAFVATVRVPPARLPAVARRCVPPGLGTGAQNDPIGL